MTGAFESVRAVHSTQQDAAAGHTPIQTIDINSDKYDCINRINYLQDITMKCYLIFIHQYILDDSFCVYYTWFVIITL